ncbi:MAG: ATP-binding cassette domain-containing protein [Rhodoferax sp.]|nr:ATP-binding cassette domain-containing protein [Rhodoferax sp.]
MVLDESPKQWSQQATHCRQSRERWSLKTSVLVTPGRAQVLSKLNFCIRGGKRLAITGPNGAGKSTIAHLLMRLITPSEGQVLIDGIDTAGVSIGQPRARLAPCRSRFCSSMEACTIILPMVSLAQPKALFRSCEVRAGARFR